MSPFIRTARVGMALLTAATVGAAFATGLPVIDGANLAQTMISAVENVNQTPKQVQQYENMLKNTAQPTSQTWDQASATMNQLRGSIDTLAYYKANLGSIDSYLGKFKDTDAYRSSPCYSFNGCTPAQWAAMKESERLGSESQKRANDALFRGLDQQQGAIVSDAQQLQRLQSSAQGATGQMQAVGYANQLASHQANQLLQIRGLLIAQQNAVATRDQAVADREAQQQAAHDASAAIKGPANRPSNPIKW